jgi:hypothetical protein
MNKPLEIKGSLLALNTLFNLIGQGLPLVVAVVTIRFIDYRNWHSFELRLTPAAGGLCSMNEACR